MHLLPINSGPDGKPVVSTLDFCQGLNIEHASLIKTIRTYQPQIEKDFGPLRFEIDADYQSITGIERASCIYLTEDQSLFVGSLSRNSERVVEFKSVLVRSFAAARQRLTTTNLPSYQIDDPIQRAQRWIDEQREKQLLIEQSQALKAKADYVDLVLSSDSELTTTLIAKELGLSAITLNRKLQQLRIQFKQDGIWILYQQYADKQYARLRTHTYADGAGKVRTSHYLVWTEVGRAFIHDRIRNGYGEKPISLTHAAVASA